MKTKATRTPRKPRKSVVAKVTKPETPKVKTVTADEWKEKMPHGNRKANKFCVDCLDLQTCVKEKLAMIIHCVDRRV